MSVVTIYDLYCIKIIVLSCLVSERWRNITFVIDVFVQCTLLQRCAISGVGNVRNALIIPCYVVIVAMWNAISYMGIGVWYFVTNHVLSCWSVDIDVPKSKLVIVPIFSKIFEKVINCNFKVMFDFLQIFLTSHSHSLAYRLLGTSYKGSF